MFRWLRRSPRQETAPAPPPLTDDEVRAWRVFVAECNEVLARRSTIPGLHHYSQQIRDAVIHQQITVEQFLATNPAPWRR